MINEKNYFIIKLGVYPFDVMVSIDESDEIISKRLIRYGVTLDEMSEILNMPDTARGRCAMLPSNQTVIRFKTQLNKYDMMSVISHEVFHAVAFIMDRIGMKLEVSISDEAYAYCIGFLTTEIYKKLNL